MFICRNTASTYCFYVFVAAFESVNKVCQIKSNPFEVPVLRSYSGGAPVKEDFMINHVKCRTQIKQHEKNRLFFKIKN